MSTLLLLRHGQASFGSDHYDRLSSLGLAQAAATGAFLAERGASFDRVLCGPRQRQLDTSREVVRHLTIPGVEVTVALDEFSDGAQILAMSDAPHGTTPFEQQQRSRAYMQTIRRWSIGAIAIPDVPTAVQFHRAATEWLQDLQASTPAGSELLAVTSAGTMSALTCAALGLAPDRMADFMGETFNAAFTEIRYTRDRRSLRRFNCTGHLTHAMLTLM